MEGPPKKICGKNYDDKPLRLFAERWEATRKDVEFGAPGRKQFMKVHPVPTVKECLDVFLRTMRERLLSLIRLRYPAREFTIELKDTHLIVNNTDARIIYDLCLRDWEVGFTQGHEEELHLAREFTDPIRKQLFLPDMMAYHVKEYFDAETISQFVLKIKF
jgi:hypothetical protein